MEVYWEDFAKLKKIYTVLSVLQSGLKKMAQRYTVSITGHNSGFGECGRRTECIPE